MPDVPQSCDETRDPQVLGRWREHREMTARSRSFVRRRSCRAMALAVLVFAGACGKKGNPLPPLRPVPSRIADLTAHRTDDRIELRFTVPSTNADGSQPLALSRVEIYRVAAAPLPVTPTAATSAPATTATPDPTRVTPAPGVEVAVPPTGASAATPTPPAPTATAANPPPPAPRFPAAPPVNLTSKNLRATIDVVQPDDSSAAGASTAAPLPGAIAAEPRPAASASGRQRVEPGAKATFVDRIEPGAAATARWSYVVVGVAGRNRRGTPSATITVPLVGGPAPPDQLMTSNTETTTAVSWKGSAPGQSFLVFDVTAASAPPVALTSAPLTTAEFTQPVEFGRSRCFAVRALAATGGVTIESPLSASACITAVDRYPPPAPANLQAVQEGAVITLTWTAVDAADLSGYIVLRGDASGERLEPLMRTPVRGAVFRDAAVQPGATYVYSVYAVDNAGVPNVSQQSNRQTVTVR